MTMKRFVALRDELDGKYDAIVISSGDYNPTKLGMTSNSNRSASHNTTNILNDITDLKAGQIKTFYIDKGLPVFLHDSSVKNIQQVNCIVTLNQMHGRQSKMLFSLQRIRT